MDKTLTPIFLFAAAMLLFAKSSPRWALQRPALLGVLTAAFVARELLSLGRLPVQFRGQFTYSFWAIPGNSGGNSGNSGQFRGQFTYSFWFQGHKRKRPASLEETSLLSLRWSGRSGSNRRPSRWQRDVLPTELRPR